MTSKPTHRKLSWQYNDLAGMIQVAPRHLAAKLVLLHLGKAANDKGQSHHGYDSIAAHGSIARRQVSPALKYLRDTLKIVTWVKGTGGPRQQDTSLYTLNLAAIRKLIESQGVFDAGTGKLIRVECAQRTGLKPQSSALDALESSALNDKNRLSRVRSTTSVECGQRTVTLNEPSDKNNPHLQPSARAQVGDIGLSGKEPAQLPDLQTDQSPMPSPKNPAAPPDAVGRILDDGVLVGWQLRDGSEVML
jgi:hypothetical protein